MITLEEYRRRHMTVTVENGNNIDVIEGPRGERGEKGDKGDPGVSDIPGPQGERGEKGDPGEPGRDGVNGKDGKDGKDGEPGPAGKDGKDGQDGQPGRDGLPGVDGKDGKDGLPGRDGVDGKNGADGLPGTPGAKGDKGDQGIQGLPGKDGKDGINGKDGAPGTQGIPGTAGKDGAPGPAGAKGDTGLQGVKGDKGDPGGTAGFTIPNTGSTSSWINLGTLTTVNQGSTLYMRIVSHAGFNADTNQSQVTEVYFKTSNGTSNVNGFYGDCTASRNLALGGSSATPSLIRVVQNSQTSYTFYGYFGTWTDGSHYTYSTDSKSSWAHSGTLVGVPSGIYTDATPTISGPRIASGWVNAGTFITLDNLKCTVTTGGNRGLSVASVAGTWIASVSANYSLTGGSNGHSTAWPGAQVSTTPSGSWFGYSFPNAGDGSTYLINDYNNQRFYRVILIIGPGYSNNFISIERLA